MTHQSDPQLAALAAAVERAAAELGATMIVELGPTSGILAQLASAPGGGARRYAGLDIAADRLEAARRHAKAQGVDAIDWMQGDALEPAGWMDALAGEKRVVYVSRHFDRFVASGTAPVERALQALTSVASTGGFVVLASGERAAEWQLLLRAGGCADVWIADTGCPGIGACIGAVLEGSYV